MIIHDDSIKLVLQYEDVNRKISKGYVTDFFGTKIDKEFIKHVTTPDVLGLPIPSDGMFHDFVEYFGLALAIKLSNHITLTVIELGAGFGPWIVRAALIGQRLGIKNITIVGIEADKQHFEWMQRHFDNNNILPSDNLSIELLNGAISTNDDIIYFPDFGPNHDNWGGIASHDVDRFIIKPIIVPAIPICELLSKYTIIDLLHFDIQGTEYDIIKYSICQLNEKVRMLIIGTHSRKIEGDLIDLLFRNGWILQYEEPCNFTYNTKASCLEDMTKLDGTQIWINERLE